MIGVTIAATIITTIRRSSKIINHNGNPQHGRRRLSFDPSFSRSDTGVFINRPVGVLSPGSYFPKQQHAKQPRFGGPEGDGVSVVR